jgi:hypothetical protein
MVGDAVVPHGLICRHITILHIIPDQFGGTRSRISIPTARSGRKSNQLTLRDSDARTHFVCLERSRRDAMYIERFGGASPGLADGTTRGAAPGTMLGTTRVGSLGQLSVALLRSNRIGPEHMFVVGRYSLLREADHGVTTTNGVSTANGVFSLVLRKTPAGWRIATDHSS